MDTETFSFLITTDNHLGYKEDDHVRRKDSYMAFEEALQTARKRDVDFVLLGGDLFHHNRPSTSVEHKCIKIIRQHMNAEVDRDTSFERISGEFSHFHKINHANFEDPNLKVPYPILTIHGNHDDPTGPNAKSVCEKLSTCGLLNYFGALTPSDDKTITVNPIILKKNKIKIALYGMGFIPDHKLRSAFDNEEVLFVSPPSDTFNILVVHQNRIPHVKDRYIPDDMYPNFFHLIIRGHEHCAQSPEPIPASPVKGLVYQPGSTVATSISTMEAGPKKIGLFTISKSRTKKAKLPYDSKYELVELKCYRQMIFKDISQKEINKYIKKESGLAQISKLEYQRYSREYVNQWIDRLLKEHEKKKESQDAGKNSKMLRFALPLLRLRLEFVSKGERFDDLEICSKYYPTQVANKDIILFKKQKLKDIGNGMIENATFVCDDHEEEDQEDFDYINLGEEKRDTIDVMIESYFKDKPPEMQLQALSLIEYTNAVRGSSEDGNVISKVLSKKKQAVNKKYASELVNEKIAEEKFHDETKVHKWFINTFRGFNGDQDPEVVDSVEDMEVIVCD